MRLVVPVDCFGGVHVVTVLDEVACAAGHSEADRVAAALSGAAPPCRLAVAAIGRHAPTLLAFEVARSRSGDHGASLAAKELAGRDGSGAAPIDLWAVPPALRRAGALIALRSSGPEAAQRAEQVVWTSVAAPLRLGRTTVLTGAPAWRAAAHHLEVTVAADWLDTVYLLGLERHGGRLTLGATVVGDRAELHQVDPAAADAVVEVHEVALADVVGDVSLTGWA